MGLKRKIFGNARRPEGFLGKMMVNRMNGGSHAALAKWGMTHLTLRGDEAVLDCGCGGGANVKKFLALLPEGSVCGLDYSEVSVEKSRQVNRAAIGAGRCEIARGSVEHIPFDGARFDLATAFETVYFWPGPETSFREVLRVLKPGGSFLIVNESDGTHEQSLKWTEIIDGMRVYTGGELKSALLEAGFAKVEVDGDEAHDRLTVRAWKE